jgi:hypothetical protein
MIGPNLILDKSAFQMLGKSEHSTLNAHYRPGLPPILAMEVLGDLAKNTISQAGQSEVAILAAKFFGSGPIVIVSAQNACEASLHGYPVPLTGQFPVDYARIVEDDGGYGFMLDLHELNTAIMRWQDGQFEETERLGAKMWRTWTNEVTMEAFGEELRSRSIIIPRANNIGEALRTAETLANRPGLQLVWIRLLCRRFNISNESLHQVISRWNYHRALMVRQFAPYAYHCLKAILLLHTCTRHKLIGFKPTNNIDLEYLFYLPFCQVFASNDKLHRLIAPKLLRENQAFISGQNLQDDMKSLSDWWDGLDEDARTSYRDQRGFYPPEKPETQTFRLFRRFMGPYCKPEGTKLTEEQFADIRRRLEPYVNPPS